MYYIICCRNLAKNQLDDFPDISQNGALVELWVTKCSVWFFHTLYKLQNKSLQLTFVFATIAKLRTWSWFQLTKISNFCLHFRQVVEKKWKKMLQINSVVFLIVNQTWWWNLCWHWRVYRKCRATMGLGVCVSVCVCVCGGGGGWLVTQFDAGNWLVIQYGGRGEAGSWRHFFTTFYYSYSSGGGGGLKLSSPCCFAVPDVHCPSDTLKGTLCVNGSFGMYCTCTCTNSI